MYDNDPGCCTCGGPITFDNCDGDMRDGVMIGFLGSSEAGKCESCGQWYHYANCGNEKHKICAPCIQECIARNVDWRAA